MKPSRPALPKATTRYSAFRHAPDASHPKFLNKGQTGGEFRLGKVKLQITPVGLGGGIITHNCFHETGVVKVMD
jgi:hypothetical protein